MKPVILSTEKLIALATTSKAGAKHAEDFNTVMAFVEAVSAAAKTPNGLDAMAALDATFNAQAKKVGKALLRMDKREKKFAQEVAAQIAPKIVAEIKREAGRKQK